jgi:hypothetical protein
MPEGSRVLGIGSCLAERMAWLGIILRELLK